MVIVPQWMAWVVQSLETLEAIVLIRPDNVLWFIILVLCPGKTVVYAMPTLSYDLTRVNFLSDRPSMHS